MHGVRYVNGKAAESDFFRANGENDLSVIDRIETPIGKIVYRRDQGTLRVFDPRVSAAVENILENVVTYGTGQYAHKHLRIHLGAQTQDQEEKGLDIPVPVMGKTGTANEFRNAAFFGIVPLASGNNSSTVNADRGYTLGTYVGYDTNEPMKRGTIHVTGSVGALPLWTSLAQALLDQEGVGAHLDSVDITFNGLKMAYPEVNQLFVPVSPKQGGVIQSGAGVTRSTVAPSRPSVLSFGKLQAGGHFEPKRFFLPYWREGGTGVVIP